MDISVELVNLTVTSYLVFQGLAPSLWGPISDVRGRRVAYCCTFLVFLAACIGLPEAKNYAHESTTGGEGEGRMRVKSTEADVSALKESITFPFSGRTAKNRFLKAPMTERLW